MELVLDEVRRLTGPNLLSDYPGAIIDVEFSGVDHNTVLACFSEQLEHCLDSVNWESRYYHRFYENGLSISISANMDVLYSACDLLELAWDCCKEALVPSNTLNFDERLDALKRSIAEEQNEKLLEFIAAAKTENIVCLSDDDEVSLGTGPKSHTWAIDSFPYAKDINWQDYANIPIALITGTNGKSTSVRLAAEIAKSAGYQAGVTSTDFIKVGDSIIDEGDYSGPGGARMLLRDKRTEIAFLEVARGGLLRRGIPVNKANAALVTNAAADHLGQYGINTVDDIAQVKLMLGKAISDDCLLVLNADDERLAAYSSVYRVPICWFSTNPNHPLIKNNRELALPCVYIENSELIYSEHSQHSMGNIKDFPMTVNGTAMHNAQNALGVVGLCKALNIDNHAIIDGLTRFGSRPQDNPGRGNIYNINGVTVIVDFAHNAHSMQAIMDMAKNMSAGAVHVMFSHGGDRSDTEILDVADTVLALQPATYILAEIEIYLRGREMHEISQLVKTHLIEKGQNSNNIECVDDPLAGTKYALQNAQKGDLVLLFVLSDRTKVEAYLHSLSA
ncbi:Mur ligase family protein [Glaciecola petra]|uniref:Mur ligase family protein n=1 Tax=Glaciecola petra TaxID=3075602 RepID=A0ABU2ZV37_9ALTE|nr:Mur ligase family protein [Aestuariibacter sp. P117]MDT0596502.1 Mur ligase family protein [Aestuariibacter sp. P117]